MNEFKLKSGRKINMLIFKQLYAENESIMEVFLIAVYKMNLGMLIKD